MQNGVVLVSYINELRARGKSLHDALVDGGLLRLRPVLMTAITTILGLTPLLLARGIGFGGCRRPLAIVVIFGLTTSTLLTLFVIPAVYGWLGQTTARSAANRCRQLRPAPARLCPADIDAKWTQMIAEYVVRRIAQGWGHSCELVHRSGGPAVA